MAETHLHSRGKWPKQLPELTPEQKRVRDDFMSHWHEVLPQRYGAIERFNHGWPAKSARPGERTLEIGAGLGEHLNSEPRFARDGYVACELRPEMAAKISERHPDVEVLAADCQQRMPYDDATFDRVLAIHVLEHLPDLPAALSEIRRLLKPTGRFVAVIPCEGGMAYSLARRVSAQRVFERRYKMPYKWCIESEHINVPAEILEECEQQFRLVRRSDFPLRVPITTINLVIGLEFTPLLLADKELLAQGGRYAVAGTLVMLVYLGVTTGARTLLDAPWALAVGVGYLLATSLHFTLQRLLVFRSDRGFELSVRQQLPGYVTLVVCQYLVTIAAMATLPELLGLPQLLVYAGVAGSVTLFSFVVLRTRLFHPPG